MADSQRVRIMRVRPGKGTDLDNLHNRLIARPGISFEDNGDGTYDICFYFDSLRMFVNGLVEIAGCVVVDSGDGDSLP